MPTKGWAHVGQPPDERSGQVLAAWTQYPAWGAVWLRSYALEHTIAGACRLALVDRKTFERYARGCPAFHNDVQLAREAIFDEVEEVVLKLALDGKNLKAALAYLRAYRPDRWVPALAQAKPAQLPHVDHALLRDTLRIKAGLGPVAGQISAPAGPPLVGEILDDRDGPS